MFTKGRFLYTEHSKIEEKPLKCHTFSVIGYQNKLNKLNKKSRHFLRRYTTENNIVLPAVDVALSSSSSKCSINKENAIQNKLNDSFPSCLIHCCFAMHIPSAASEPGTNTFCVRFNSPSTMLKSYSFNPLWAKNTTIFQETPNLYHILKPIVGRLFQKIILGRSPRSSFIGLFSFARNAATLRKVLAPFSFSHVIDYFFFLFSFSLFFLVLS